MLARGLERAIERRHSNARERVTDVVKHINRTIEMTREIARGLSPVQIEHGSLSAAIERLASSASQRLRIEVVIDADPADIQVSDVAADHLHRIVYEAIANAARHRACDHVEIELRMEAGSLEVSVTDEGQGSGPTWRRTAVSG